MAQSIKLGNDTYLDAVGIATKMVSGDFSKSVNSGETTEIVHDSTPSAGVWLIASMMDLSSNVNIVYVNSIIVKNSNDATLYAKGTRSTGTDGGGNINMYIGYLPANSTVSIRGFHSNSSALTMRTRFMMVQLAGANHS